MKKISLDDALAVVEKYKMCYDNHVHRMDELVYQYIVAGLKSLADGERETVSHPSHYNQGGIETFDVIKAFYGDAAFEDFCAGNVLKYVMRYRHKGNAADDLRKEKFYIDEILENYGNTQS